MATICSRVIKVGVAQGSRFLKNDQAFYSNTNANPRNFRTHFGFSPCGSSLSASTILCRMDATAKVSSLSNGGDGVVRFPLSPSSALVIQKGDITKWSIDGSSDAIVCFFLFYKLKNVIFYKGVIWSVASAWLLWSLLTLMIDRSVCYCATWINWITQENFVWINSISLFDLS